MGIIELLILAVGLSMDAFAVSVSKGLAVKQVGPVALLTVGLWFGGFQAGMPVLGYFLGFLCRSFITSIDHWIAFALLTLIGFNMIWESWQKEEERGKKNKFGDSLGFRIMFLLAVATSIDALAVGITFAFLKVSLPWAVCLIGVTTFLFSDAGLLIGRTFGKRYKTKAERAGGVILILLGLKILLEGLGGGS